MQPVCCNHLHLKQKMATSSLCWLVNNPLLMSFTCLVQPQQRKILFSKGHGKSHTCNLCIIDLSLSPALGWQQPITFLTTLQYTGTCSSHYCAEKHRKCSKISMMCTFVLRQHLLWLFTILFWEYSRFCVGLRYFWNISTLVCPKMAWAH